MTENDALTIGNSRQATIALDLFKPFLEKERASILAKLKSHFRANEHDLAVYLGLISTLVSLDDIEQKMVKTVNAGRKLGEKLGTFNGE